MNSESKYLIEITKYQCSFEDGVAIQNCQNLNPAVNGNNCENLVKSLTYIIRYDNSIGGIVETGVKVVFFNQANYLTTSVKILQEFKIMYIPSNVQLSDYNLLESQKLSGNPGYIFGKPIKSGILINSGIRLGILNFKREAP